jgi:hypothetical protein
MKLARLCPIRPFMGTEPMPHNCDGTLKARLDFVAKILNRRV